MYFMSRELSEQLTGDAELATNLKETIASALNTSYKEPAWPWEDIYTGLALAQIARGLVAVAVAALVVVVAAVGEAVEAAEAGSRSRRCTSATTRSWSRSPPGAGRSWR